MTSSYVSAAQQLAAAIATSTADAQTKQVTRGLAASVFNAGSTPQDVASFRLYRAVVDKYNAWVAGYQTVFNEAARIVTFVGGTPPSFDVSQGTYLALDAALTSAIATIAAAPTTYGGTVLTAANLAQRCYRAQWTQAVPLPPSAPPAPVNPAAGPALLAQVGQTIAFLNSR
jgi:uncharacterized protein (DUF4415 family)